MFYARLDGIASAKEGSSGIVLQFTLDNRAQRHAQILSYNFELWLLQDEKGAVAEFLAPLSPDLKNDFEGKFGPHDQRPLNLVWHYTPKQLQRVEDWRRGADPLLQIRGHFLVASSFPGKDGSPEPLSFEWEKFWFATASRGGTHPAKISVPHSEWTALLNQIGFRHITLYELPLPSFPPGFARSEDYLKEAWEHHWAGRRDEALLACRKAFEGLGFNLFGDDRLPRREFLNRLLSNEPIRKKETLLKFWESLQNLLSDIGVHEKGEPVELTHADSEMALICVTALLGYFAKAK